MGSELKVFLDEKVDTYNQRAFIEDDPISVPHNFSLKEDIEISAFIVAAIAWGKRSIILKSGNNLLEVMGNQPYQFVLDASDSELEELRFVHRTFNSDDLKFFVLSLRNIYVNHGGLQQAFIDGKSIREKICNFRERFLLYPHEKRSEKHISNPGANSACKRINMFLRWMVRKDKRGVDFGIWDQLTPSELCVPLDVHVGRVARELGLLERKMDDWKALDELMLVLRKFDPDDPAKYDFALFGIGMNNDLKAN
jgi:uncharacterized protein (TIGR02757 family)